MNGIAAKGARNDGRGRVVNRRRLVPHEVAGLSVAEAANLLNAGEQLRFRNPADSAKAPEIIAAAGPGLPIYSLWVHGKSCSPIACR